MTEEEQKYRLKEDERYCEKCKLTVHKKEFNEYFHICWQCTVSSRSH